MLMKCMTPSRAGVDEMVHGSGSVLLLDRSGRCSACSCGSASLRPAETEFGCVLNRLFLFKTPLLSRNRPCCLPQGIFIPPC